MTAVFSKQRPVDEIEMLSPDACRRACEAVLALKAHWTARNLLTPFYTIGAVSYLDARRSQAGYVQKAAQENPILRAHFEWLYACVVDALSKAFDAPVALHESHGLPGFHIFMGHPMFRQKMGEMHCDLQFKHLDWRADEPPDMTCPISFTLPVALPARGGGMNLWDYEYQQSVGVSKDEIRAGLRASSKTFVAYRVGHCAIHSGLQVHQIAPIPEPQSDDMRITLQGHALRCGRTWRLYW